METVPNFTPRAQEAIEIAKENFARESSSSVIDINHICYGVLALKADAILKILSKSHLMRMP